MGVGRGGRWYRRRIAAVRFHAHPLSARAGGRRPTRFRGVYVDARNSPLPHLCTHPVYIH